MINAQSGDPLKYTTPKLKKKRMYCFIYCSEKKTALWLCSSLLSQNNISEGHRICDNIKRLFLIVIITIERGRKVIKNEIIKQSYIDFYYKQFYR